MNRRWMAAMALIAVLATPAWSQEEDKEAKIQKDLDEARALCREAVPLFVEVAAAMAALPSEKDKLNDLVRKADSCENKLIRAQGRYDRVKKDVADPDKIASYVKRLEALQKSLREWMKKLKAAAH